MLSHHGKELIKVLRFPTPSLSSNFSSIPTRHSLSLPDVLSTRTPPASPSWTYQATRSFSSPTFAGGRRLIACGSEGAKAFAPSPDTGFGIGRIRDQTKEGPRKEQKRYFQSAHRTRSGGSSSTRWKSRQGKDSFARDARVLGLKSRAAFKLLEVRFSSSFPCWVGFMFGVIGVCRGKRGELGG